MMKEHGESEKPISIGTPFRRPEVRKLEQKLVDLSIMYELVRTIIPGLHLTELLDNFLLRLTAKIGTEVGLILLSEETGFEIGAHHGDIVSPESFESFSTQQREKIIELCPPDKIMVFSHKNGNLPSGISLLLPGLAIRSAVSFPLVSSDGYHGSLLLFSFEEGLFTVKLRRMISDLAQLLSTAIRNARLHDNLQLTRKRLENSERHLKYYSRNLEMLVDERTAALTKAISEKENSLARIQELHNELEEFVFMMTRDLRVPLDEVANSLTAIENITKIGSETRDNTIAEISIHVSPFRKELDRLKRNTEKIGSLVSSLSRISEITTDTPSPSRTNLSAVLKRVLEHYADEIKDNGITLNTDLLPVIICDGKMVENILDHLISQVISNTLDVNNPQVDIGYFREKGFIRIFIKDNGSGIPESLKDRLFSPLGMKTTSSQEPYFNVDFVIVRKLVEKLGGRVDFESEPGLGTTFYFTLPTDYFKERKRL